MSFARPAKLYDGRPLLACLCCLCMLPAFANTTDETIEEITVVARRTLVSIKRQMLRADIEMYRISNTLIDDPLYKVWCLLEPRPGSRIKHRVCKPGFERKIASELLADEVTMARFAGDDPVFGNQYDLSRTEIRKHREILKQKFIELAADNPTLAKAIYERANLNLEYEKTLQRKHEEDD